MRTASYMDILGLHWKGIAFSATGNDHADIVRHDGKAVPTVAEIEAKRSATEEHLAAQAKAVTTLQTLPVELLDLFRKLDGSAQAKWSATRAGLQIAIADGRLDIARNIIADVTPATSEEIEIQKQMLALFD